VFPCLVAARRGQLRPAAQHIQCQHVHSCQFYHGDGLRGVLSCDAAPSSSSDACPLRPHGRSRRHRRRCDRGQRRRCLGRRQPSHPGRELERDAERALGDSRHQRLRKVDAAPGDQRGSEWRRRRPARGRRPARRVVVAAARHAGTDRGVGRRHDGARGGCLADGEVPGGQGCARLGGRVVRPRHRRGARVPGGGAVGVRGRRRVRD